MSEHDDAVGPVEPVEHRDDETTHAGLKEQETPEATEPDEDEQTEAERADEEYRDNRRLPGPGDKDYDPRTDKLLTNSVFVDQVREEMSHSDDKASPTWEALYAEWDKANPEVPDDAELEEDENEEDEDENSTREF